ncbi:unnamed protein product [Caenorhabditis angaria]|uniref:Tyrosine-protein kinase n=1 Tax=Caenorhabditis angaria TaxID=860376 RepID=A0A9P1MVQ2_9PELO|nr:unnamed protein product [Caenorhabditis angaria]
MMTDRNTVANNNKKPEVVTKHKKSVVQFQVQEFGPKFSKESALDRDRDNNYVITDNDETITQTSSSSSQMHQAISMYNVKPGTSMIGPPMISVMGPVVDDESFDEDEYIKKTLRHFPWYWGLVLSTSLATYLKNPYSFIVRRTIDSNNNKVFLVSVRENDTINHYEIRRKSKSWMSPKLFGSNQPKTSFAHIHKLLDAWSLTLSNGLMPIPKPSTIVFHDNIKMTKVLGKGAFGDVWQAKIILQNGEIRDCAIKMIRGDATRTQIAEFYQEVQIMALFDNPYVIKYYGTACLLTPVMVAMELLTGGDLWTLLRSDDSISNLKQCEMSSDIAKGMKHLAHCKIIHRDLAARNCLLTADHRVKISDFGLSVQATQVIVKKLKQAPIRWLSPETLTKGIFNEKTDVWSYGVVLWEIFTKCANPPLHPKTMKESAVIIKEVDNPHRLQGEKEISDLISFCCKKDPTERLTFEVIVSVWDAYISNYKEKKIKKKNTVRKSVVKENNQKTVKEKLEEVSSFEPKTENENRPKGARSIGNKKFTNK